MMQGKDYFTTIRIDKRGNRCDLYTRNKELIQFLDQLAKNEPLICQADKTSLKTAAVTCYKLFTPMNLFIFRSNFDTHPGTPLMNNTPPGGSREARKNTKEQWEPMKESELQPEAATMSEEAREARNAYKREWNRNNPEKRQAQQRRYWERKARQKRHIADSKYN